MPNILSCVAIQDEQSEEKPVKFPRPDTSQMTPFKPTAGAGKKRNQMFNRPLINYNNILTKFSCEFSCIGNNRKNLFPSRLKAPLSVLKPQNNNMTHSQPHPPPSTLPPPPKKKRFFFNYQGLLSISLVEHFLVSAGKCKIINIPLQLVFILYQVECSQYLQWLHIL